MNAPTPAASLADEVVTLDEYQAARAHWFPSTSSLRWTCRKHRAALITAGALVVISGRKFIHRSRMDDALVNVIGPRSAKTETRGGASTWGTRPAPAVAP